MPNHKPSKIGRKHLRYRCNQRLCVRYQCNGQQFIAYGRCTIVGKGGIGASMPAVELEIGQVVSLEISISGPAAPGVLRAQVKSRSGSTYGFQFLSTAVQSTATLRKLFQPDALATFVQPISTEPAE
jgi:hypothetical protein